MFLFRKGEQKPKSDQDQAPQETLEEYMERRIAASAIPAPVVERPRSRLDAVVNAEEEQSEVDSLNLPNINYLSTWVDNIPLPSEEFRRVATAPTHEPHEAIGLDIERPLYDLPIRKEGWRAKHRRKLRYYFGLPPKEKAHRTGLFPRLNQFTDNFMKFQRTGPSDLYSKPPRNPHIENRPFHDELNDDFTDDETSPLTEPIYGGR